MKKFIITCCFLFLIPVVSITANTNVIEANNSGDQYTSVTQEAVTGVLMANDAAQEMLVLQKLKAVDNNINPNSSQVNFIRNSTETVLIVAVNNNHAVENYLTVNQGIIKEHKFGAMNKFTINANLYQSSSNAMNSRLGKQSNWRIGFDNRNPKETSTTFVNLTTDVRYLRAEDPERIEINLII